jgi:hypothetical protein
MKLMILTSGDGGWKTRRKIAPQPPQRNNSAKEIAVPWSTFLVIVPRQLTRRLAIRADSFHVMGACLKMAVLEKPKTPSREFLLK